jgi:predicted nucleic acid-binding OB-fold protein
MERYDNSHEKNFCSSPASNLNFEIHSLELEPTIASPIVPNILQEVEIKQEKEIAESFEEVVILNVPCIIQDQR